MKIYIAGKITGDPDYKEKFMAAEEELKNEGHAVMSPAVLPGGFTHDEYMHICYSMINVCEAVCFLEDWRDSKGATMEHEYAERNNKKIIYAV